MRDSDNYIQTEEDLERQRRFLLLARFALLGVGMTTPTTGPPAIISAPAITGTPVVGQTLSVSDGTWGGAKPITGFAYQWKRDGVNVGTNTNSYGPLAAGDADHVISCTVTATNSAGSTPTNASGAVFIWAVPANTAVPLISGTAQATQPLSTDTGTWTHPTGLVFAYQWKADGSNVGSNSASYSPTGADVGKAITVTVTASNLAGSANATSAATSAVLPAPSPPNNVNLPVASPDTGGELVNDTLTCTSNAVSDWSGFPTPTLSYQWYRREAVGAGEFLTTDGGDTLVTDSGDPLVT